jgi:hypothetical protein
MKVNSITLGLLCSLLILYACGNKGQDHTGHGSDATTDDGNQVLYNQVMDIHDEVMPKTEEIYNISKKWKAALKDVSSAEEKELIQRKIDRLDSVNNMMMDWMHEFKPLPDTTNEETARAYYERHLEKIKRVKEAMLLALEEEK